MKKKAGIIIPVLCGLLALNAAASVFYTKSSSSIYNSDGISQSKSAISSPIGGTVTFRSYGSLPKGSDMYSGAVFDGESIWLVPLGSDVVAEYSTDGDVKTVSLSSEGLSGKYFGGTFDGSNIYFAPYEANGVLQISKETGEMALIETEKNGCKYKGAVFDGEFIWFIPSDGKDVLCMDSLGEIKSYIIPFDIPSENAFCGGVLAGERIYFVPDKCNFCMILNINTGEFRKLETDVTLSNFSGGIFEGDNVYFIPKTGKVMAKVAYNSGETEKITLPENLPDTSVFGGGAFDGRYIWFSPVKGGNVLKYDIYEKTFYSYTLENPEDSYTSGAFDGNRVWLAPLSAAAPLTIGGNNTPPSVPDIFLTVAAGSAVDSSLTATDEDDGDTITFEITAQPQYGSVTADTATGNFTYTPASGTGEDFFLYRATDGVDFSNVGKVTIIIEEGGAVQTGRYVDLWGHWAENAANSLTEEGVFLGENVDGLYYFYPDRVMTRGEFTVIANSSFGFEGSMSDDALPFEDVSGNEKWIVRAASGAYRNNMVFGAEENGRLYFKANEPLTRVEAMAMIYNVIHPKASETEMLAFEDRESYPAWSLEMLKAMKTAGMLKGYDDNTVRPYNKVTRAEAVQLLYEALNKMGEGAKTKERLK